jgi:hypothetical protein
VSAARAGRAEKGPRWASPTRGRWRYADCMNCQPVSHRHPHCGPASSPHSCCHILGCLAPLRAARCQQLILASAAKVVHGTAERNPEFALVRLRCCARRRLPMRLWVPSRLICEQLVGASRRPCPAAGGGCCPPGPTLASPPTWRNRHSGMDAEPGRRLIPSYGGQAPARPRGLRPLEASRDGTAPRQSSVCNGIHVPWRPASRWTLWCVGAARTAFDRSPPRPAPVVHAAAPPPPPPPRLPLQVLSHPWMPAPVPASHHVSALQNDPRVRHPVRGRAWAGAALGRGWPGSRPDAGTGMRRLRSSACSLPPPSRAWPPAVPGPGHGVAELQPGFPGWQPRRIAPHQRAGKHQPAAQAEQHGGVPAVRGVHG